MKKIISLLTCFILIGCKNKEALPVVSTTINELGIKETYAIQNFHFTSQQNESFTDKNTANKVYIANFFFTRCPSICPPMREKLIDIATTFTNFDDFIILSFTIDPTNDNIPILKNYSKATKISSEKWFFLRGDENELSKIATQFRTHFSKEENGIDFYHSSFVALVDRKQHVRGYYNVLDQDSFITLKEDILKLK